MLLTLYYYWIDNVDHVSQQNVDGTNFCSYGVPNPRIPVIGNSYLKCFNLNGLYVACNFNYEVLYNKTTCAQTLYYIIYHHGYWQGSHTPTSYNTPYIPILTEGSLSVSRSILHVILTGDTLLSTQPPI